MSYYLMHRGWMNKRIFEREKFNRLNAWEWMIEHAAFTDGQGLARGQLRHSLRFLAKAWGWDVSRVCRWLSAATDAGMIRHTIDTGRTLITICNYDQYQLQTDSPDTHPTQNRYSNGSVADTDLKKEEGNKEDSVPIGTRQSARQITEWMVEIWKEVFGSALTTPTRHNEARLRTARARFADDFHSNIEEWRQYLHRIRGSPWLMGSKGWRADFDWVLKPANMTKIIEGRYDQRNHNGNGASISIHDGPDEPAPKIDPATWESLLGESKH